MNRIRQLVVAATIVLAAALASPAGAFAPMATDRRVLLTEAYRLAETIGAKVWPGFDVADAAVVLVSGETEYLVNRATAPTGFLSIPLDGAQSSFTSCLTSNRPLGGSTPRLQRCTSPRRTTTGCGSSKSPFPTPTSACDAHCT